MIAQGRLRVSVNACGACWYVPVDVLREVEQYGLTRYVVRASHESMREGGEVLVDASRVRIVRAHDAGREAAARARAMQRLGVPEYARPEVVAASMERRDAQARELFEFGAALARGESAQVLSD